MCDYRLLLKSLTLSWQMSFSLCFRSMIHIIIYGWLRFFDSECWLDNLSLCSPLIFSLLLSSSSVLQFPTLISSSHFIFCFIMISSPIIFYLILSLHSLHFPCFHYFILPLSFLPDFTPSSLSLCAFLISLPFFFFFFLCLLFSPCCVFFLLFSWVSFCLLLVPSFPVWPFPLIFFFPHLFVFFLYLLPSPLPFCMKHEIWRLSQPKLDHIILVLYFT